MKNYKNQAFIVIQLTFIILLILSLLNTSFTIGNVKFKPINIFSDILKKEDNKLDSNGISQSEIQNKVKSSPFRQLIEEIVKDSLKINIDSLKEAELSELTILDFSGDSITKLPKFFKAVKDYREGKKKTVRIAYFGDSMIEGDLITQTLRYGLQSILGGNGVGFVPITSNVANFRRTIVHSFSSDWLTYSYLKNSSNKRFGISGFVFNPKKTYLNLNDTMNHYENYGSWVCYSAPKNSYFNLRKFHTLKLYYGKGNKNSYIVYTLDGNRFIKKLDGKNYINELILNDKNPVSNVKINFYCDSLIDVYGLSFESDSGIFVDNYAVRGSSGLPIATIPDFVMKNLNYYLNYDLVILQFGVNVAAPEANNFEWYEKGMNNVVNHIKKNIPTADILIISVSDRAYRKNAEIHTQPSIPKLVATQKRIAKQNKVAFWNLYESMGGYNSMKQWVNAKIPLANKDYTHFNYRGAEKIGTMLKNNIILEYKIYEVASNVLEDVLVTEDNLKNPIKQLSNKSLQQKRIEDSQKNKENFSKMESAEQSARSRNKCLSMMGIAKFRK